MTTAPLRAATVGGTADDIEALFYDALRKGDIAQLMACWADEDDITCVHPGGPRMTGAGEIRAAFEAMFAHGTLQVRTEGLRRVQALASAVHTLVERIALELPDGRREACVVATNVYHKTAQGWRLVTHHASPGTAEEAQHTPADAPPVLH